MSDRQTFGKPGVFPFTVTKEAVILQALKKRRFRGSFRENPSKRPQWDGATMENFGGHHG
jgi:hypothetical protein